MKTAELSGAALDWAVAKAEGWEPMMDAEGLYFYDFIEEKNWMPTTDWAQGGPIIEREMISIEWTGEDWAACIWVDEKVLASSPLVAAMRCYVASKLGDEVETPAELLGAA